MNFEFLCSGMTNGRQNVKYKMSGVYNQLKHNTSSTEARALSTTAMHSRLSSYAFVLAACAISQASAALVKRQSSTQLNVVQEGTTLGVRTYYFSILDGHSTHRTTPTLVVVNICRPIQRRPYSIVFLHHHHLLHRLRIPIRRHR